MAKVWRSEAVPTSVTDRLLIGLPKGRGLNHTHQLCRSLGVVPVPNLFRYTQTFAGFKVTILLLKFRDIAELIAAGQLHLGVTGNEWILETGLAHRLKLVSMPFYHARLCLLTRPGGHSTPRSLRVVASPYARLSARLVTRISPRIRVLPVTGSCEALVPDVADAAIDLVETGRTAREHSLVSIQDYGEMVPYLVRSPVLSGSRLTAVVDHLQAAGDAWREH